MFMLLSHANIPKAWQINTLLPTRFSSLEARADVRFSERTCSRASLNLFFLAVVAGSNVFLSFFSYLWATFLPCHLALTSFCLFFCSFLPPVAQPLTVFGCVWPRLCAFFTQKRTRCPPPASWHRFEQFAHISPLSKLVISRDWHDVGVAVSAALVKGQCCAFARFVSVVSWTHFFSFTCLFVRDKKCLFPPRLISCPCAAATAVIKCYTTRSGLPELWWLPEPFDFKRLEAMPTFAYGGRGSRLYDGVLCRCEGDKRPTTIVKNLKNLIHSVPTGDRQGGDANSSLK